MPPAAPANILIRDTIEADLPELFRIHVHPMVRLHELPLKEGDTVERWRESLFETEQAERPWGYRSTTILRGEAVVGQITHIHSEENGQHWCVCGWSLDPEHWGQGIAVTAVSRLFDVLFDEEGTDWVISSCYSGNDRCVRLMQRLHYEPARIGLMYRIRTANRKRSPRWMKRFLLSADRWRMKTDRRMSAT